MRACQATFLGGGLDSRTMMRRVSGVGFTLARTPHLQLNTSGLPAARIKTQTIPMTVSTQLWWEGLSCLLMLSVTYLPMLLLSANVLLQIVFSHKQFERLAYLEIHDTSLGK